ncbi:MAG: hypothetical protein ACK4MJ_07780 [Hylemonella sp.]
MPERLPPELREALAVLERHRVPEPEDAAEWAQAVLVLLAHDQAHILEAMLPAGWCTGFWPEALRCTLALAQGHQAPQPLDWYAQRARKRRKLRAGTGASR